MRANKTKGIGDLVAKLAAFSGAKVLVKSVLGEDCGCDERQEFMNELMPFKGSEPSEEVDDSERYSKAVSLAFARDLIKHRETGARISKEQFLLFWDIYRYWVNPKKNNTQCVKCVNTSIDELERVLTR